MSMETPSSLNLIPTDELIAEVAARFDWAVFMGRKITQGDAKWEVKRRYKGDVYVCLGLADNMADFLNQQIAYNEETHDGKGN